MYKAALTYLYQVDANVFLFGNVVNIKKSIFEGQASDILRSCFVVDKTGSYI